MKSNQHTIMGKSPKYNSVEEKKGTTKNHLYHLSCEKGRVYHEMPFLCKKCNLKKKEHCRQLYDMLQVLMPW